MSLPDLTDIQNSGGADAFYGSMRPFRGFASLMDPALYRPVPDG